MKSPLYSCSLVQFAYQGRVISCHDGSIAAGSFGTHFTCFIIQILQLSPLVVSFFLFFFFFKENENPIRPLYRPIIPSSPQSPRPTLTRYLGEQRTWRKKNLAEKKKMENNYFSSRQKKFVDFRAFSALLSSGQSLHFDEHSLKIPKA